jgi:hypothetical protein
MCYDKNGGGDRTRTRYLLLAKQPLSQLSYTPTGVSYILFMHLSMHKILIGAPGQGRTDTDLSTGF